MINKIENRLKDFFRYKIITSAIFYFIYKFIINLIRPNIFFEKIKYFSKVQETSESQSLRENGFIFLDDDIINDINSSKIISIIDNIISKKKINIEKNKAFTKLMLTEELICDKNILNFFTNKRLIEIIASYLGEVPQILHAQVWHSPNQKNIEGTSQEFHLDHEDGRQIKLFLYIEDVTSENGPMQLLNKNYSKKTIIKNNYSLSEGKPKRLDVQNFDINKIFDCTGKKNSILLIDTTKVLHRGSLKSSKPRTVLMAQYVTKYTTSKNKDIIHQSEKGNLNLPKSNLIKNLITNNQDILKAKKYLQLIS